MVLGAGKSVIAEVGKILYTAGGVEWNVVIPGRGWSAKIAAGFRRKLSGGSVVMTEYTGPGAVGLLALLRPRVFLDT